MAGKNCAPPPPGPITCQASWRCAPAEIAKRNSGASRLLGLTSVYIAPVEPTPVRTSALDCRSRHIMETRTLKHTELTVSRACFGTMTFGSQADEAASIRMIDLCIDQGVNFIDTANVYNKGLAET